MLYFVYMKHKSGFVNIIGKPNVGKSTLLNVLLGEQISIVTNKVQTTRHRIHGILNSETHQIVFADTPGLLDPAYPLQELMMKSVSSVFEDADIIILILDIQDKNFEFEAIFDKINKIKCPLFLVLNKIDTVEKEIVLSSIKMWSQKIKKADFFPVSALKNINIDLLLNEIIKKIPYGQPYYGKDQLTDKSERFIVEEKIREKILNNYQEEIPYSVQVVVDSFKESADLIKIYALIFTERKSQKNIIIGKNAQAIKKVCTESRKDLERFFKKKIFLETRVKVSEGWRKNEKKLRLFGYN